ncbi:MAG: hypothetical protein K2I83_02835, partial [Bacteroidales bacterium]|nr:hypothetical protein [Bacteroidales bacterium]
YSVDGGKTHQDSSLFENLKEGWYRPTVKHKNGCVTYADAEVYISIPSPRPMPKLSASGAGTFCLNNPPADTIAVWGGYKGAILGLYATANTSKPVYVAPIDTVNFTYGVPDSVTAKLQNTTYYAIQYKGDCYSEPTPVTIKVRERDTMFGLTLTSTNRFGCSNDSVPVKLDVSVRYQKRNINGTWKWYTFPASPISGSGEKIYVTVLDTPVKVVAKFVYYSDCRGAYDTVVSDTMLLEPSIYANKIGDAGLVCTESPVNLHSIKPIGGEGNYTYKWQYTTWEWSYSRGWHWVWRDAPNPPTSLDSNNKEEYRVTRNLLKWSDDKGERRTGYFRRVVYTENCYNISNQVYMYSVPTVHPTVNVEVPVVCPGAQVRGRVTGTNLGANPAAEWFVNNVRVEPTRKLFDTLGVWPEGTSISVAVYPDYSGVACPGESRINRGPFFVQHKDSIEGYATLTAQDN